MANDKRKQSLYFPEDMLTEIFTQSERLDRSLSWVVQRCVKVALKQIKELPSVDEPDSEAAE